MTFKLIHNNKILEKLTALSVKFKIPRTEDYVRINSTTYRVSMVVWDYDKTEVCIHLIAI